MFCPLYYAFVFTSTKLEIRAEQVLLGRGGGGGERVQKGTEGRNDPKIYTHVKK
jgi:hypothetical protein